MTKEQEELREAIWQKHKPEELALIREIEKAQKILKELQGKYTLFEEKVTSEIDAALAISKPEIHDSANFKPIITDSLLISKVTCSKCKQQGHNKRSCKVELSVSDNPVIIVKRKVSKKN